MVEGSKWLAGLLALCLPLTAFAHADESAYVGALAGQSSNMSRMQLPRPQIQWQDSREASVKGNEWIMARASCRAKRHARQ